MCELDVATRRIVGGNDSPPELDSPCQESFSHVSLARHVLARHVSLASCTQIATWMQRQLATV